MEQIKELEKKFHSIQNTIWATKLHLMPPVGWLNDPNGLCQFHSRRLKNDASCKAER